MYVCRIGFLRSLNFVELARFDLPAEVRFSFKIDSDDPLDGVGARASFSTSFKVPIPECFGVGAESENSLYYSNLKAEVLGVDGERIFWGDAYVEKSDGKFIYFRLIENLTSLKKTLEEISVWDIIAAGNAPDGQKYLPLRNNILWSDLGSNGSDWFWWDAVNSGKSYRYYFTVGYCENSEDFNGKMKDFRNYPGEQYREADVDANQCSFEYDGIMRYGCYPLPNCQLSVPMTAIADGIIRFISFNPAMQRLGVQITWNDARTLLDGLYLGFRPTIEGFSKKYDGTPSATYFDWVLGMKKLSELSAYDALVMMMNLTDCTIVDGVIIKRSNIYDGTQYSTELSDFLQNEDYTRTPSLNTLPKSFRFKFANSELCDDRLYDLRANHELMPNGERARDGLIDANNLPWYLNDRGEEAFVDFTDFDLAIPLTKKDAKFEYRNWFELAMRNLYNSNPARYETLDAKILPEYGDNFMIGFIKSKALSNYIASTCAVNKVVGREENDTLNKNYERYNVGTLYYLSWQNATRRLVANIPAATYYDAELETRAGWSHTSITTTLSRSLAYPYIKRLFDKAAQHTFSVSQSPAKGGRYIIENAKLYRPRFNNSFLRKFFYWKGQPCRIVEVTDYDAITGVGTFKIETIRNKNNFL